MYLKQPGFKQKFLLKIQERHPDVHLAIQEYPGALDVFLLRNKEKPAGPQVQEEDRTESDADQAVQEQPGDQLLKVSEPEVQQPEAAKSFD